MSVPTNTTNAPTPVAISAPLTVLSAPTKVDVAPVSPVIAVAATPIGPGINAAAFAEAVNPAFIDVDALSADFLMSFSPSSTLSSCLSTVASPFVETATSIIIVRFSVAISDRY